MPGDTNFAPIARRFDMRPLFSPCSLQGELEVPLLAALFID
jgi:hypothetical protein